MSRTVFRTIVGMSTTLFVVTSCNADFNLSRLERYLALALDARVTPVIVLTKADLEPSANYVNQARTLRNDLDVFSSS